MERAAKPTGPIPPAFAAAAGELLIAGVPAREWVRRAGGAPLFVYDAAMIAERIARFRAIMPARLGLHYAVKANPFAPLLAWIAPLVDGFDVASGGELAAGLAAGMPGARIGFAGPGKRDADIRAAIQAGATLMVESATEATRALAAGAALGIAPRLAIRVNPDFALGGAGMRMGGGAKPFGVDAEAVPALIGTVIAGGAEWRGLHIYPGSQSLDAAALVAALRAALALADRLADAAHCAIPACTLGGGFGIAYHAGQQSLDADAVARGLGQALAELPANLADTRLSLELGRWLVGEAGVYLAEVIDRKVSHGTVFVVVDGGMHHQLAASGNFGAVVRRNYPLAIATRFGEPAEDVVDVCGCLCTPLDRLGEAVALPRAAPGDLVAVFLAGAYGASASPAAFLSHPSAREILAGV